MEARVSLRLRAVLITGIALSLLWASAAAWLTIDMHTKLDRTLENIQRGVSGGDTVVNLHEDASKAGRTQTQQMDGKTVIDVFVSNIRSDGNAAKAMQQAFGLRRAGR